MEVKKPCTFDEQLDKLVKRGCIVDNISFAEEVLHQVNYYRFTAYFLPFKEKDSDTYKNGTQFSTVYNIYEFDRKMRNILSPIMEEIEIMLRTQLAYHFAHKYGSLGYEIADNFNNYHKHDVFMGHIEKELANNRDQPSIQHHVQKYESKFPIWVIVEYFTMGELSFFYSDMKIADKKELANKLFDATEQDVSSWLMCLTILRNFCAHYSRLYYYILPARPGTPAKFPWTLRRKLFDYILVLLFLYRDKAKWNNSFLVSLESLIIEYQEYINLDHIGFPQNWNSLLTPNLKLINGIIQ